MTNANDLVRDAELSSRATAFVQFAIATDTRHTDAPLDLLRAKGYGRFSTITKEAVEAITSADAGIALAPLASAFLGLVDRESIVGQLTGAVRIPITGGARFQIGEVVAHEVAEGGQKPTGRINFDIANNAPTKVVAEIIASAEALKSLNEATQNGIRSVLVSAVAAATDVALVSTLTAGTTTGTATPEVLLAAVSGGAPRRPVIIGGLDMILAMPAGTVRDLSALGVRVLATPAASGRLIALDESGLLVSDLGATVETARHASLVLDDGGSPSSDTLVNLWQNNLSALRAERWLRFALRSGAAAWSAS